MGKNELRIDICLQEPQCTMIRPWYSYQKDSQGMPSIWRKKVERDPNNLVVLENTISQRMQRLYQDQILETLEKKIPILYIDCQNIWNDDIMFYILKQYIQQSPIKDTTNLIGKVIWDRTLVVQDKQERNDYIQKNTPSTQKIFDYYSERLKILLDTHDDAYKKMLLDFEKDIGFDGLGELMKHEGQKYLYLYIDKIQSLSIDEQQRINTFLYTRWAIAHDRYIRVKINDGAWVWKTWNSSTGHKIETPHDYSEVTIYEDKL